MANPVFDVCVIGSGPGGGIATYALASARFKMLIDGCVRIVVDAGAKGLLRIVKEQLAAHPGGSPVFLHAETPTGEHVIRTETLMDPDEALLEQVRRMLGGGPRRAWVE